MLKRTCITGISKRRFYHLFLIAFAFIALFCLSNAPVVAGQDSPKASSELLAKAQATGSVRIIVRLDMSSQPEGMLSGLQEVIGQQTRISRLQDQLHEAVARHNVRGIKRFKHIPYNAMEVDSTALGALIANPLVVSIEEDVAVSPSLTQSVPLIKADQAWTSSASGYTGEGWTVAILDTGVDKNHSFIGADKVVAEACFSTTNASATTLCPNGKDSQTGSGAGVNCDITSCSHGTHVAGIAAGKSATINGVAKDANIIAIQVYSNFSGSPLSYTSDQILALEHVYSLRNTYKIAAVNMSLGSGKHSSSCNSDSRKAVIDNLRAAGIATVISSGNDGYGDSISSPACISTAVSVGATYKYDAETSYSNYHPTLLSLFAPGSSIYSSVPGGGWAYLSGTSMAAPHVTGAWAILKQKSPSASVTEILNNLQTTGATVTKRAGDEAGDAIKRIDVKAALDAASSYQTQGSSGTGNVTAIPDTTPKKFKFKDQKKVDLGEIIYSNDITVSGLENGVGTTISITAGGEYSIKRGDVYFPYTSDPGTVYNGDIVTVRQTASAICYTKGEKSTDVILDIGGVKDTFSVTTETCDTKPDKFTFAPKTGVPLNTPIESDPITVSGINTVAVICIGINSVGGEYSINHGGVDSPYTGDCGWVVNGDTVMVRQTSSALYSKKTTMTLTIGKGKGTFKVTTLKLNN